MAFVPGRGALVATALVLAAPAGAWAATPAIKAPYYSARWKVLVLPYEGELPRYTVHTLTNPPRVYLDLQARAFAGARSEAVAQHPQLVKWSIAPRGEDATRVTLTFRAPAHLRVIHNPQRKLLLLMPQAGAAPQPATPAAPAPSASPTARPTPAASPEPSPVSALPVLGRPRYDVADGGVAIPFSGGVPAHHEGTLTNPPRVYFDFKATGPKGFITGADSRAAALTRWVMGPRDAETVRVTLTLKAPGRVLLRQDEARHELVLVPVIDQGARQATPAPRATARPSLEPIPTAPPQQAPLIPGPESDMPASGT